MTTLANQKVLVTGASGFIGSRLCHRLGQLDAEVHGVSRADQTQPGVVWWRADLADPEEASRILRSVQPEVVFHLASHVTGERDVAAVLPTMRDNLVTTVGLLAAACEVGVSRVVLAGSMEECAPGESLPGSPYAAAKTAASAYARMFHALYGLPVVNLRTFMVYGPGQRDGRKLVPYVTNCLLRGEPPRLSSGERAVDWVYVDDVVEAFVAAAVAADVGGASLDVGSGELVTIRALVEQLAALVGGDTPLLFGALDDRPMERRRIADLEPTKALIGWAPSTPLEVGLRRTVEWYRSEGGG